MITSGLRHGMCAIPLRQKENVVVIPDITVECVDSCGSLHACINPAA